MEKRQIELVIFLIVILITISSIIIILPYKNTKEQTGHAFSSLLELKKTLFIPKEVMILTDTCNETDRGDDPTTKGNTTGKYTLNGSIITVTDECWSPTWGSTTNCKNCDLIEYYCGTLGKSTWTKYKEVECEYGEITCEYMDDEIEDTNTMIERYVEDISESINELKKEGYRNTSFIEETNTNISELNKNIYLAYEYAKNESFSSSFSLINQSISPLYEYANNTMNEALYIESLYLVSSDPTSDLYEAGENIEEIAEELEEIHNYLINYCEAQPTITVATTSPSLP